MLWLRAPQRWRLRYLRLPGPELLTVVVASAIGSTEGAAATLDELTTV